MLDFTSIIAGVAGQRETFEELVCQIARREPPDDSIEFRRIHGAGGDGGVEAVWLLKTGEEIGYQAKYYTTSAGVDWRAIDCSVDTALATHPSLTVMYIAVACALTGPTRRTKQTGLPTANGWSEWEKRKAQWIDRAKARGRSVDFIPWTAPDLEALLNRPAMVGLTEYWFGAIELTSDQLKAACQRTVDALEERYHPEDHVDVSTRAVFDGLLHNDALRQSVMAARSTLIEARLVGCRPGQLDSADVERLDAIDVESKRLTEHMANLPGPGDLSVYDAWEAIALKLRTSLFESIEVARDLSWRSKDTPPDPPKPLSAEERDDSTTVDYHLHSLSKLQDAVGGVLEMLATSACRSDASRFALLDGRAGSGKSHLMASEIERALAAGAPALFLIGTNFTVHGTPENQILAHCEWGPTSFDKLLGALSARAEVAGMRGLVAIDALNEGAGAALWREKLQGFARRVLDFPNLSLCVSCRREYLDHLITPAVGQIATKVEVTGFETPADVERAARVYMDKRGIVRPATPWLNPEFSNPLFLRTTCLALQAEGRTDFPRGMRGTSEVLNFYLVSTGRHLGTTYDGSETLVDPLRSAVLALAAFMACRCRDSVTRTDAHRLVEHAFEGFAPPPGKTWLETLRFRGLLRYDPDPDVDRADPLTPPSDVIRFSFQRFGDHLIARALLQGVTTPNGLFEPGGRLAFLLGSYGVAYEWRGLFYALFLQFADRYGVELVDHLPGGFDIWWDNWPVEDAFVDSIRWRAPSAFSERTRELLNRLRRDREDVLAVLIELAVVEDHPWNIEFLHRNLTKRCLAERDSFWTVAINAAHHDPGHALIRLTDWSLSAGVTRAGDGTLGLALITLAWTCTSTSARVRDTASKAMISIFASRPSLIAPLFARFAGCDDPYVVERLFAALYGAALRTLDPVKLARLAMVAWTYCFEGVPPVHLLARDYARGTVELAEAAGALDPVIDLARCRPPYGASPPYSNVSKARVDARGKQLGARQILGSCYYGIADFGRYVLEGRVKNFADARLSGPRPITSDESGQAFFDEVTLGRSDLQAVFTEVRAAHAEKRVTWDVNTFKVKISAADRRRINIAEAALMRLLTPAQRKRFDVEASYWVSGSGGNEWSIPGKGKGKEFDAQKCKIWVANRALSFGWTDKRFPGDNHSTGRSENRGRIERIGKKYQRIALMELLARLADNFWLKPEWGDGAKIYNTPLDISFTRDLEPSIIPADQEGAVRFDIPRVPPLVCEPLPVERRRDWVMDPDLPASRLGLATCRDFDTPEWLTLYRYAAHDIDAERENRYFGVPWLQSDFHFLAALLVTPGVRKRLVDDAVANAYDFHDWLPSQIVDEAYLGELARRDTWRDDLWTTLEARKPDQPKTYPAIRPTISYGWESHLDGSLPEGFSRHVPIPWLINELSLSADVNNAGTFLDAAGIPVVVSGRGDDRESHVLVRRDPFLALARNNGLEPLWTVIGERSATTVVKEQYPDIRTRYNGLMWFEGDETRQAFWSKND
ncbi:hypothetical protein [Novosphingobium sp. Fuku2-ISO-50]|uniref:hypothetical protein n=1 Tax=Novosphingobium sp. Fuku2-ISO-50 TaxID=1739114 RepID=UPI000ADFBDC9|nr:hypothetical protein [Novosphingobium sp. Fuku2-ISO-50]